MNLIDLKTQIHNMKQRIAQLDQYGYEEESALMTESLKVLEGNLEDLERQAFEMAQLELEELLKEKEEKPKRTRRRRTKKPVEEDTPE